MIETPECDEFQKTHNEFFDNFYDWVTFAREMEQRALLAETRLGRQYEKNHKILMILKQSEEAQGA